MNVIVFDIGGTLMEYEKMPLSWEDYYEDAFRELNKQFSCGVSDDEIMRSVEILKSYNPRINYRENEISPAVIFSDVLKGWKITYSPLEASLKLQPQNVSTFEECNSVRTSGLSNKSVSQETEVKISGGILDADFKHSFYFYKNMNLNPVIFDDTISVLTELKNRGFKIAALTDLPTGMSDDFFKDDIAQLLPYFDFYVSSQSCGFRKPNPTGLKVIAEKFGVLFSELIFVGDEEKDRKTAKNAGCRFFKITRGEGDEKFTLQNFANVI